MEDRGTRLVAVDDLFSFYFCLLIKILFEKTIENLAAFLESDDK